MAPAPRRRFKAAWKGRAKGEGDIRELTDELAGYSRLRVGSHRIVFKVAGNQIRCIYAAPRKSVYEFAAAHMREVLGGA